MGSDRWIAGLAALATIAALLGVLTMTATRGPAPSTRRAPVATPMRSVCMTERLICAAPEMPSGYPCSCNDPLRGITSGVIVPAAEASRLAQRLRGRPDPSLDDEGLLGP